MWTSKWEWIGSLYESLPRIYASLGPHFESVWVQLSSSAGGESRRPAPHPDCHHGPAFRVGGFNRTEHHFKMKLFTLARNFNKMLMRCFKQLLILFFCFFQIQIVTQRASLKWARWNELFEEQNTGLNLRGKSRRRDRKKSKKSEKNSGEANVLSTN